MSCVRPLPPAHHHVEATSTTAVCTYLTDWLPGIAMDAATATLKLANTSGSISVQACIQMAIARTDEPSAPSTVGTAQTTNVEYYISAPTFDLATVVPGNAFIRFGVSYKVTTTPNQGQADVIREVAYRQCGVFLPPWRDHLVAVSTTRQFVPVTGWLPALGVLKIEGAVVVSSVTGNFVAIFTYRTAEASPDLPSAWDTTGIGSAFNGGEQNTGELPVTTTGMMWVQIGVMYYLSSGSTPGNADLSVLLGIRSAT